MNINKTIKRLVNSYPRLTSGQIIRKVSKFDVVSFDVFDTLLKRDVTVDTDIFEYIGRMYFNRFGTEIPSFREKRIRAWREAVKSSKEEEISLQDIYTKLVVLNNQTINGTIAQKLMDIELELEKGLCRPNPVMTEVYQYCVKAGKRIICISDMYLSKSFILDLLHKSGYTKINELYLSSAAGVQKKSGALFKYVLKAESLKPGDFIHIGDNKRTDLLAAAKLGIHTVCIARNDWHTRYWKSKPHNLDSATIRAFLSNRLCKIEDRREAIGYEVYGPLLYFFTKWLCERLDNSKSILFFARDCYIVKQAYELMNTSTPLAEYFLASRKSLTMPALYRDSSLSQILKMVHSDGFFLTLEDILKKFELDPQKYEHIAEKQGLTLKTIFQRNNLLEDNRFLKFWPLVADEIRRKSVICYKNFREYFDHINSTNEIQVVDIGWHCTMQYCLEMALDGNRTFHGYYIGVRGNAFSEKSNYEGFFLDGVDNVKKISIVMNFPALLEVFFSAPHGTVQGYNTDGKVVFGKYEHEKNQDNEKLMKNLQKGALEFVKDMLSSPLHQLLHADPELLFMGLEPMASAPRREEIELFADMPFNTGIEMTKVAAPRSLAYYLIHPKQCLYDFAYSQWKVAFLKRLFKIPLPYDAIFKLLYRLKKSITK